MSNFQKRAYRFLKQNVEHFITWDKIRKKFIMLQKKFLTLIFKNRKKDSTIQHILKYIHIFPFIYTYLFIVNFRLYFADMKNVSTFRENNFHLSR